MSDQRQLRGQLDKLRDVTRELVDGVTHEVPDDDGKKRKRTAASWLEQLAGAVETGAETGKAGGRAGIPVPLDLAALMLQHQIDGDTVQLHLAALRSQPYTAAERIRAIVGIVGRSTDTTTVSAALAQLEQIRDDIKNLLDPDKSYEVAAACPSCGTRMVWRQQDDQNVQVAALTLDRKNGRARCLSCDATWPYEHLGLLVGMIEHQQRQRAPRARVTSGSEGTAGQTTDTRTCTSCDAQLPPDAFAPDGLRRRHKVCRDCVRRAERDPSGQQAS